MKTLRELIQSYTGMQPRDKGCKSWPEMDELMEKEIRECISRENDTDADAVNYEDRGCSHGDTYQLDTGEIICNTCGQRIIYFLGLA